MELSNLSQEQLEEWRDHPVSVLVRQCLWAVLERERDSLTRAYWAGSPASEDHRQGYLRKVALWEDLFEATADDFRETMER